MLNLSRHKQKRSQSGTCICLDGIFVFGIIAIIQVQVLPTFRSHLLSVQNAVQPRGAIFFFFQIECRAF